MIEPIMYLAIGFLVSMLFGLMILPLVHNRAVRLTTRRMEAATPLSMAEIQADKDQLRADFAMSARKLELSVEQLRAKTASQLAELGKKSDAINRMKLELSEKTATIFSLEAREKSIKDQLRSTEEEFAAKTLMLRGAEQELIDKQAELAKLNHDLSDKSMMADSRQLELVALRTQIDALQSRVGDAEKEFTETGKRLDQERAQSEAASRELAEARERLDGLNHRVTDLDRQLLLQVKEAELASNRASELETENKKLLAANEAAMRTVQQLRDEMAALGAGAGPSPALEKLRGEKAALERELDAARDERAAALRELATIQKQAESSWAQERMENALLRERINDIAAEVAKLAMQLEGPNSAIDAILAAEPAAPAKPPKPANDAAATNGSGDGVVVPIAGTLADRIRALQSHASRARPQGA
jgi:DNA repair exonuclease SbcCD ATPase subunit